MTKKAIDFVDFLQLSMEEQLDILYTDGVHIGKRIVEGNTIILFQLNDFYAEVDYIEYRKKINKITPTKNLDVVQPYLSQVRVRDLDDNNS